MNHDSTILQRVGDFIARHAMLRPECGAVVVGFSGGADSMALIDILTRLGYRPVVAHCNFTLRGDESERDNRFARAVAARYGLPFEQVRFATEAYAAERGVSVEMAARELRYAWFEELRMRFGAQAVAVAHHADDSVETFFLNLLRGTGIAGLTGIPARNGEIVRPLLCLTRSEIEGYIAARELTFVTDSTNLEDHYRRNKIRLNLLPMLSDIAPGAVDAVRRTMSHLADAEAVYQAAVDDLRRRSVRTDERRIASQDGPTTYINIAAVLSAPAPEAMLFELLRPYGVSSVLSRSIFSVLTAESGRQFHTPDGHYIVKDRTELQIVRFRESPPELPFTPPESEGLRIERIAVTAELNVRTGRDVALFDASKVRMPLHVRRWRQGDRFVPFGMKKPKKLSDYFRSLRYSLLDKERARLLVDASDRILWLIGERTDDRFRLTAESTEAIRISITPRDDADGTAEDVVE